MSTITHECDCGFKWQHGQSGTHRCEPNYRDTIAKLREALAEAQAAGCADSYALQSAIAAQAPSAPQPMSEHNARFAIDGAIQYGREARNRPPSDDHWLMEYWLIGQQLRELGKTGWDNRTPLDPAERIVVAPSAPSAEEYSDMLREFFCCYAAGGHNDDGGLVPLDKCREKLDWIVEDQRRNAVSVAPSAPVESYPEIPEGWKLVPKTLTDEMQLALSGPKLQGTACQEANQAKWSRALYVTPTPPQPFSTLAQQVASAQAEVATWTDEKRASVRLAGGDQP